MVKFQNLGVLYKNGPKGVSYCEWTIKKDFDEKYKDFYMNAVN